MKEHWLSHQLEDAFWRHGSVAFEAEAIRCPVLAVGGMPDPYRNAVLELLASPGPSRFGLIGPWAHGYPHASPPGPRIGFLRECEAFFGRYLRDWLLPSGQRERRDLVLVELAPADLAAGPEPTR